MHIIIIIIIRYTPYPATAGSVRNNAKKINNGSGQKTKPHTPTQTIDALIGEEEHNIKQKEE